MFLTIEIAYKSRFNGFVRNQVIMNHPIYDQNSYRFYWILSHAEDVVQFIVYENGQVKMPKDFGWANMDKWVEKLTYISEEKLAQKEI